MKWRDGWLLSIDVTLAAACVEVSASAAAGIAGLVMTVGSVLRVSSNFLR